MNEVKEIKLWIELKDNKEWNEIIIVSFLKKKLITSYMMQTTTVIVMTTENEIVVVSTFADVEKGSATNAK